MNLLLVVRATVAALAISLGGSLLVRTFGFDIDPAVFAVIGAVGGATFAATSNARDRGRSKQ